jgi:putative FmdB family regulatory protein
LPLYDYKCEKCEIVQEVQHSMNESPKVKCKKCKKKMQKLISGGCYISQGIKPRLEDHKESEHKKKTKDPERAVRARKKMFGHDAVGDPKMVNDPRHVVKKGKTLGGREMEVDKGELIRALAKDPLSVAKAQDVVKKNSSK